MSIQLHRPEFDELLVGVPEIATITRDWLAWMGFCPDALADIAIECGRQSQDDPAPSTERVGNAYLLGFMLGVLSERAIEREHG